MRIAVFGFVVAAAVVLPGCLSETPIAPGAATPIDDRLLGTWRCVSGDEDGTSTLTVARQSATSYSGSLAGSGDAASPFEAYLVGSGDGVFANVKDTEKRTNSAKHWTLIRPTFYRPDVLHLEVIDDEKYEAQRKHLPAALKDPKRRDALFADWCTCVRIRAKS